MAALEEFNVQPADRAVQALRACNAAPRFAAQVVAGRPYPDADTLVARAEEVTRGLPWEEVVLAVTTTTPSGELADLRPRLDEEAGRSDVTEQLARVTARRVRELVS